MGLETFAAAALAFRGLGALTSLFGRLGGSGESTAVQAALAKGEPVSRADFDALLSELMGLAENAGAERDARGETKSLRALAEHQQTLSPMLFDALDRDGNGTLEGEELRGLQRFVGQVGDQLPDEQRREAHALLRGAVT